jgi:hypothetical protein
VSPWVVGSGLVGVAAIVLELWRRARPKRVFVSYDHSEDRKYKQLLQAWNANSHFRFEFDERSPKEAIESDAAGVVKAALTRKMKEANYLLVIIGTKSNQSPWMAWEIERAKQRDIKLRLAAVKIDRGYQTPAALLNVGVAWAYGFTREGIVGALSSAKNDY